ncbi:MAG TPA: serine hydroxymethyltransferase, partial [Pseudobdellovibrionaceae bacterium]|nr:serine hydroxymethyltransferase [Pseudobdellovibrionaceae bacterium]
SYIHQVILNAKALANELMGLGFNLVTNGTDNHLLLVDLTNKNITGKEAELALDEAGITVNKNTVPQEKRSPFVTSGIRIGTPALTTRGMKENEMKQIAHWIKEVLEHKEDQNIKTNVHNEIKKLSHKFPIYSA